MVSQYKNTEDSLSLETPEKTEKSNFRHKIPVVTKFSILNPDIFDCNKTKFTGLQSPIESMETFPSKLDNWNKRF